MRSDIEGSNYISKDHPLNKILITKHKRVSGGDYDMISKLNPMMHNRDIDENSRERITMLWLMGRPRREIEAIIKSYPKTVLQIRAKKSTKSKTKRKTCSRKRK